MALLTGVVAVHFVLVNCCGLHPWLGGGFGMFSTVDERHLRAWVVGPEGAQVIELPETVEDSAERAEALPSEARLRRIATELAADPQHRGRAVRVEVWETRFDSAMQPLHERLGAAEVGVTSDRP